MDAHESESVEDSLQPVSFVPPDDNSPNGEKRRSEQRESFLITELELLRSQIEHNNNAVLTMERWSLVVSGGIWSFLTLEHPTQPPSIIFWCPAILSSLFGLRALGIHRLNVALGRYIARLEQMGYGNGRIGWETNLLTHGRPALYVVSSYGYFSLLLLLNIVLALVFR